MTRLRFPAPLALVAALTALLVGCGGDGGGETTIAPDATPREVAQVAGFQGVQSGSVDTNVILSSRRKHESIALHLTAGFNPSAEGEPSSFALTLSSQGEWHGRSVNFNGNLVVLPDGAVLHYGPFGAEQAYQADASSLEELRSKFAQAEADGGKGDLSACLDAAGEFSLAELLPRPKIEAHRKEADGSRVVLLSGAIDLPRLHSLLAKVARDPDCAAQLAALGLPSADEIEGAKVDIGRGYVPRLTVAVDRHGVIHALSTRFDCARMNGEIYELELSFSLGEVNQPVDVSGFIEGAPVDNLLRKFGTSLESAMRADATEVVLAVLEGLGANVAGQSPEP